MRLFVVVLTIICLSASAQVKLPKSPNQFDEKGLRTGFWTLLYDSVWKEVKKESEASYYRLIRFESGKPSGKVRDFFTSYQKQWEGYLLSVEPEIKTGEAKHYFENGQLQIECFYENGKMEGPYKEYAINGKLLTEGKMESDSSTGVWTYYNEEGIKYLESETKGKFLNGLAVYYHPNGAVSSKGKMIMNKRDGPWIYYYDNSKILTETSFHNDENNGSWRKYSEGGILIQKGQHDHEQETGLWEFYFDNGKLKSTGVFEEGKKVGHWKYYYENGKVSSEGDNVNGLGEGSWKYYHENGALKAFGELTEDLYKGYWQFYFDNGQLNRKGEYVRDSLDGHWLYYYENGQLKTDANYSDNKRHGTWKYFTAEGIPNDIENYWHGKLEGETIKHHPDGSIQTIKYYKQDSLDGKFVSYFINGQKESEGHYKRDQREGEWNWYFENGKPELHYYYNNGKYDGEWVEYFDNGKVSKKGSGIKGLNDGLTQIYYSNGQLEAIGNSMNGERNGKWKFYDSLRGTLQSEGMYVKGNLEGKWRFYTPEGKKDGYGYYINGFRESYGEIRDSIQLLIAERKFDLAEQHIKWLKRVLKRDFPKKSKRQLIPIILQAEIAYAKNDYKTSIKYYEEYGKGIKLIAGDTAVDYETALNGIAINLNDMGLREEAVAIYDRILTQSNKNDPYSQDAATVTSNKALALNSLNRTSEGEAVLLKKWKEIEDGTGVTSKNYFYISDLVGSFYKEAELTDKSLEVYKSIYNKLIEQKGNQELLLKTKRNIGIAYRSKELRTESNHWLKAAVAQAEESNHLNLSYFTDLRNIGDSYLTLRFFDSARFYFEKEIKLMEESSFQDDKTLALALDGLGKVNYYTYQTDSAIALWKSAKSLMERSGSANTIYYADMLQGLALALKEKSNLFDEAEKIFLLGVKTKKEVIGEFTSSYRSSLMELSGFYIDNNQFVRAGEVLSDVKRNINSTSGKQSLDYARLLNASGQLEYEQIHYAEAIKNYDSAIAIYKKQPEGFREDEVLSYQYRATSQRRLLLLNEALQSITEAMRIQAKYKGENNSAYLNYKSTEAYILLDQKRYGEAEKIFLDLITRFEKLAGKQNIQYAQAYRDVGYLYFKKGDYVKAKLFYERYLQQVEDLIGKKSKEYLSGIFRLGDILYEASSIDDINATRETEKKYLQSVSLASEIFGSDLSSIAYYVKELSNFYYNVNMMAQAEKRGQQALDMMRKQYGDSHRLNAPYYQLMGKIYHNRNKNREAEEAFKQTLSIYKEVDGAHSWGYINTLGMLATFHESLGQYAESEREYKESLTLIEKMDGGKLNYAKNLTSLGYTYFLWSKESLALEKANEAIVILEDEVEPGHYLTLDAHNLAGLVELELLKLDEAEKHFNFIIAENKKNGNGTTDSQISAIHNLATVSVERGQYDKAEKLFMESKRLHAALYNKEEQSPTYLNNLAALYQAWGKGDQAEKYWNKVTTSWMKYIQSNFYFLSDQEKALFWAKNKKDFESFNTFALKRQKQNPAILAEMYNNQLNTKAILLNASNKIKKRILSSQDSVLINSYHSWIEMKETLAKYYSYSNEELKEKKINLDSIQRSVQGMEKDLNITASDVERDGGTVNLNWKDIQKTLAPNEAAIEIIRFRYFDKHITDSVVYTALIITSETKTSPQAVVLNPGSLLEGRAFKYYKNMIAIRQRDERSYEIFWSPLEPYLKNKSRLYVSLDGVYNQINLNTLGAPDGSYLVDSKNITLVSNTKDILLIKGKQSKKISKSVATLVGHPKFFVGAVRKETNDSTRSWDGEDRTGIADLPGTEKEIEKVESILSSHQWETNGFTGEEATELSVKQMQSPRILHIATHGFFIDQTGSGDLAMGVNSEVAEQDPLLRSGLLFSGAADFIQNNVSSTDENGILTAYEAANLSLDNTDLVVLSACETGKGEVQNGEGVYGLQRAFQTAGAKAVVMSLWKVDDEATQELMTSFYQNWMNGQEKSVAFKSAQQELKKKFPEPYYWGAFVMTGQ